MIIDNNRIRPWTITWRDKTWHDHEARLTAGDVVALQALVNDDWASCNPWASPAHLAAMIAVLFAREESVDPKAVLLLVYATDADEFMSAIEPRLPPVAAVA